MTCPGTERVFVNPAACQSSPKLHKPLSTASPPTRPSVPAGSKALQCLASCRLPRSCSRGPPHASLAPHRRGEPGGLPWSSNVMAGALTVSKLAIAANSPLRGCGMKLSSWVKQLPCPERKLNYTVHPAMRLPSPLLCHPRPSV